MHMFLRSFTTFSMSLALFALTALVAGAATSLKAQAGAGSSDQAVQVLEYFPGSLTVDVGDTVTWSIGSAEPHTVSFGTPPGPIGSDQNNAPAGGNSYDGSAGFVSSGFMPPGKTYSLTFTKAGTFNYACMLHPTMRGTVVVQPAGTAYPASQASYQPANDPKLATAINAGKAMIAAQTVTSATNANGSKTYTMTGGYGDNQSFAVLRFGASNLTINTGDSVTWIQKDLNEIHTVTFLNNGQDVPFTLPNGATNPQAAAPAGGKVYSGTGYFNSGILTAAPAPGPHSYTLTFDKAGTFNYICLLHDEAGMVGTITVKAASAVPGVLPKSGGLPIVLIGGIGLALIVGGVTVGRRAQSS